MRERISPHPAQERVAHQNPSTLMLAGSIGLFHGNPHICMPQPERRKTGKDLHELTVIQFPVWLVEVVQG